MIKFNIILTFFDGNVAINTFFIILVSQINDTVYQLKNNAITS